MFKKGEYFLIKRRCRSCFILGLCRSMAKGKEKEKGRPWDLSLLLDVKTTRTERTRESSFLLCIQACAQYHLPKDRKGRIRFNIMWKYYSYYSSSWASCVGKGFTGTGNGHSLVESARGSTCISTQTDYVTYLWNVMYHGYVKNDFIFM